MKESKTEIDRRRVHCFFFELIRLCNIMTKTFSHETHLSINSPSLVTIFGLEYDMLCRPSLSGPEVPSSRSREQTTNTVRILNCPLRWKPQPLAFHSHRGNQTHACAFNIYESNLITKHDKIARIERTNVPVTSLSRITARRTWSSIGTNHGSQLRIDMACVT